MEKRRMEEKRRLLSLLRFPFLRDVAAAAAALLAIAAAAALISTPGVGAFEGCGLRGSAPTIIGGERAAYGEFPWQISLRVSRGLLTYIAYLRAARGQDY